MVLISFAFFTQHKRDTCIKMHFCLGRKSRGSKWENGRRRAFKSDACYVQRFIGPNSTSSEVRMLFGCVIHTCSLVFKPISDKHTFVKKTNKSKTQKSRKLIKMWARPRDSFFFLLRRCLSSIFQTESVAAAARELLPWKLGKDARQQIGSGADIVKKVNAKVCLSPRLFFRLIIDLSLI